MKTIRHRISFSVVVLDGFTHQLTNQTASLAVLLTLLIRLMATRVTRGSALVARRRRCSSSFGCRRGSSRDLFHFLSVYRSLEMENNFAPTLVSSFVALQG